MRDIRKKLGLSQAEMGSVMGMSQQAISRIESGRRKPTIKDVAFLRALEVIHNHDALNELIDRESL